MFHIVVVVVAVVVPLILIFLSLLFLLLLSICLPILGITFTTKFARKYEIVQSCPQGVFWVNPTYFVRDCVALLFQSRNLRQID